MYHLEISNQVADFTFTFVSLLRRVRAEIGLMSDYQNKVTVPANMTEYLLPTEALIIHTGSLTAQF